MSELSVTIGKRIRSYRESAHQSREVLAERADMHPTYLGQLERGEKNATLESISKVAHGLGIPLEYLVEHTAEPSAERSTAAKCYDLVAEQSLEDQKKLYHILKSLIAYKNR